MSMRREIEGKESILSQPPPAYLQRPEHILNPSPEQTTCPMRSPLHRSSEIIPSSQRTDSSSNELNNLPQEDDLSNKMAVVPFVPSAIQNSVYAGEIAVSGALTSANTALSSRRVCPTCLRPFYGYDTSSEVGEDEMEEIEDPATDGAPSCAYSRRRKAARILTPAYFRMLTMRMPLAIGDSPDPAAARGKHSRCAKPERDNEEERSEGGSGNDRERVVGHNPPHALPLCYYVSPTDSMPRDYAVNEEDIVRGGLPRPIRPPSALVGSSTGDHRYLDEDPSPPPPLVRRTVAYHQTPDDDADDGEPTCAARKDQNFSFNAITGLDGYYARYFIELQKLGSGTYGGVYLCQHVMEGIPLGTFALKKVPVGDNLPYLQKVLHEVRILGEVNRHPNVVEYNHSWVETAQLADFGPPVRCLFILMEYATEGSLDAYMARHGTALSTPAVWYFFLSAVAGTTHLHGKGILHRDLKPQNLLLTGAPGGLPRVLVSDFGTAALLSELGEERTGGTGTLEYMAPELLAPRGRGAYPQRHTPASDAWSLGMILHYLACGATLPARRADGTVAHELDPDLEACAPFPRPPEMVQLMRAMLQPDPARRPGCREILRSTVAQTILRSFNSQTKIPEIHVESPPAHGAAAAYGKPPITRRAHPQRLRGGEAAEERAYDDNLHLQSSKVELISTSAMLSSPLLMQYHTNDAMAARGGGKDGREDIANATNSMLSLHTNELPGSSAGMKGQPAHPARLDRTRPHNQLSATWAAPLLTKRSTVSRSVQTDLSLPLDA